MHQPVINPLFFFFIRNISQKENEKKIHRSRKQKRLIQANTTTGTAQSKRETKEIISFPYFQQQRLSDDQQNADWRQLCAALPCVALQHPVRILPRKTVLILKINQLFSTKAQPACRKNARLGSLGTWSAHCYDNLIRSGTIYPDMVFTRRRWPIVSVSSSKVSTFSIVFVSSSNVCGYGSSSCKQEAYPERFLSG